MMKKQKNIPELRFSEFEDSWIKKKLGDYYKNLRTGMTPYRGIPEYYKGDIPWISSGELNYNVIFKTNENITKKALHDTNLKLYPINTFFIAITGLEASGTRGKCAINGVPAATNQSCMAFEKNPEIETLFLYYWYSKYGIPLYYRYAQGTKQQSFNNSIVEKFEFIHPTLPEQQKIASFLTAVDDKLQALKKKKELLKQYKKGVMQKIFSQEIRFKITNQDGELVEPPEWEKKKGKDIFYNHSNKNHNGDLPVLSASQEFGIVLRDENGIQIQSSENSIKSYKIVEKGDFVISLRSFQGGIEYSNLKGICSPAYTILKPKIPIVDDFFKYYFKKEDFIERLSKTVVGIRDGKQISYEAFGGLKLSVPSTKEQLKIANFLSAIDKKINHCQAQIEKTEQWKKGLLQKMFV